MYAGGVSGSGQANYQRSLPGVHFRSHAPRFRAANENRRAASSPAGLALCALRLAPLSTAAVAFFALRLLPSS
jgi:hypothetical protein